MNLTQRLMYFASAGYFACLYAALGAVIGGTTQWVRIMIKRGR